ncbi:MAG TPA: DEAD/DEAH box helicase [Streptosporangiaceae bacterium]|nr:DEAD/DEAH box helicase [Streptosporangiaceae bacterium]
MPDDSRRRRAPARHHHAHSAERGRPDRGAAPTSRGRPGRPGRPARTAARRRPAAAPDGPHGEIDRALAAAANAPAPETTFRELGLPARLVSSLAARGIDTPFAIQARVLPDALAGRDVLGRAQTGSGKTLAFGLPILARLAATPARRREKAPRALVLVPTRELARQVTDVLVPLGQPLGVSVTTVYGGVAIGRQIDRMRRGVDIVVATPGRLIDLLDRKAATLDGVEITVLDEADHMADLGFLPAVTRILDATPAGGQRMLFSATLDRGVGRLVTAYLSDPALHAVAPEPINGGTTEHRVLVLPAEDKVPVAVEIASRPARTLFFVRTKHGADRLARQLSRAGVDAAAIHGNLNQNQRQRALAGFAAGRPRVLVATDVAARGIHVDDVDLVVHFDPPNDHKDYLHRSGRTARAGASGMVIALAERAQVRDIERLHDEAGVTPTTHHVHAGHDVVRQLATSGTPVSPPAAARPVTARPAAAPSARGARRRRHSQGPSRAA